MSDNPRLAYSVHDAVVISGVPRTKLYELIGAGSLQARKCGRRTLVTADSLRRYLDSLPPAKITTKPKPRTA